MFTVHCLVDNRTIDAAAFRAEHGLALVVETPDGRILFDTGQSGEALLQNAARAGVDLCRVDALALSHAHYDHSGGLSAFLEASRSGLPLYAHSDLFRPRYAIKDGEARHIGMSIVQSDLAQRMQLRLSAEPMQILPGVWTTGEIDERPFFEGRSSHHYVQTEHGWLPDPYRDDLSLVLETGSGVILVCGCCHAGLLNTLAHVRRMFAQRAVIAILGGAHLAYLDEHTLGQTIDVLRKTCIDYLPNLYLNHCTGERALAALAEAFGEKVSPFPAGAVLRFG